MLKIKNYSKVAIVRDQKSEKTPSQLKWIKISVSGSIAIAKEAIRVYFRERFIYSIIIGIEWTNREITRRKREKDSIIRE